MRVTLQVRGLWITVSLGTNDLLEERMALEVIFMAVPPEMLGTMENKANAKIAWEATR